MSLETFKPFETEELPPNVENPDLEQINKRIKEIYAEDDEEKQKQAEKDITWFEEFWEEQSEKWSETKDEEREKIKLNENEEEKEAKMEKARQMLEEWIDSLEKQKRENDPMLKAFIQMAKRIESEKKFSGMEQR